MSKGLITTLIILGGLVVIVGGFFMWGAGTFDNAVAEQEKVNAQ